MPQQKTQLQRWFLQVKQELLRTEPQNILARAECCERVVHDCVDEMHQQMGMPAVPESRRFRCCVSPRDHLQFLVDWPGLRVDNSPRVPTSIKSYEKKAKNWLNGRRAPNYGRTLFPWFIHSAQDYIEQLASKTVTSDPEKRKLYSDALLYAVLAKLCGCSVSLHEQAKKAPFFCKNSIERRGRLKEILQGFASEHPYAKGFPSCFEEAVGYFESKSKEFAETFQGHFRCALIREDTNSSLASTTSYPEDSWKDQIAALQSELAAERERRQKAEHERDQLRQWFYPPTLSDYSSTATSGQSPLPVPSNLVMCHPQPHIPPIPAQLPIHSLPEIPSPFLYRNGLMSGDQSLGFPLFDDSLPGIMQPYPTDYIGSPLHPTGSPEPCDLSLTMPLPCAAAYSTAQGQK